jgi:beta-glucosidase
MTSLRARLVCPALRSRRGSFAHERDKIEAALAAGVGGFILFGGTLEAVRALTRDLKQHAGRPLLFASDLERGAGQQFRGLTELPTPAALGYLNDLDATYAAGSITGTEARAVGLTWAFAPVCDLDLEPRNPIVQTRAFGADPERVGAHAAAWIRGCQEHGVLACAKHYPGHGRTTTDSHAGLPVVDADQDELQRVDVAPFAAAVQAGVGSVMAAHVAYPSWDGTGVAATFSPRLLGHLRDVLGFQGLIVTDAFIMAGATAAQSEGPAAAGAVTAGCDVLLYPTDWMGVVRALDAVPADRASAAMARYDAALRQWEMHTGDLGMVDEAMLVEHQKFADGLADRAVYLIRGDPPELGKTLSVTIVDDDVGGP